MRFVAIRRRPVERDRVGIVIGRGARVGGGDHPVRRVEDLRQLVEGDVAGPLAGRGRHERHRRDGATEQRRQRGGGSLDRGRGERVGNCREGRGLGGRSRGDRRGQVLGQRGGYGRCRVRRSAAQRNASGRVVADVPLVVGVDDVLSRTSKVRDRREEGGPVARRGQFEDR